MPYTEGAAHQTHQSPSSQLTYLPVIGLANTHRTVVTSSNYFYAVFAPPTTVGKHQGGGRGITIYPARQAHKIGAKEQSTRSHERMASTQSVGLLCAELKANTQFADMPCRQGPWLKKWAQWGYTESSAIWLPHKGN